MELKNLYKNIGIQNHTELIETLLDLNNLHIERIISSGHITPENEWYDQEKDEWVVLLQGKAELLFEKGEEKIKLNKGDFFLIPAHCRHRVTYTSAKPPCIWLAVHFKNKK